MMILVIRSGLQASISSVGGYFVDIICKGEEMLLGTPHAERKLGIQDDKSRVEGVESAAPIFELPMFFHCLRCTFWNFWHVQCFGVDCWIRLKDYTLASACNEALFI